MGRKAPKTALVLSAGYLSPPFWRGLSAMVSRSHWGVERRIKGSYLSTIPSARHGTVS